MTNKIIIAAIVLTAALGLLYVQYGSTFLSNNTREVLYTAKEVKLTFTYPASLYLHRPPLNDNSKLSLVLVENTPENLQVIRGSSTIPREGPTSIGIEVYENPKRLPLRELVESEETWKLSDKKTKDTLVGGVSATTFIWDGLYMGKTTVVSQGAYVYVFRVTYLSREDQLLQDEETLLKSVKFLP
jgi:hypothetical protein